jgi:gliding motility-associated protein GldE
MATVLALAVIALLLLASAAMSASEVALFSLSPAQLRELRERGDPRGMRVLDLLGKPRRLLATILIANNFVNIGIVVLSAFALGGMLDLRTMPNHLIFIVEVVVVTFVLLLVGEVVPKVYATGDPLRVALRMAIPLKGLRWFFWPLSNAMVRSTNFIERRYRRHTGRTISADTLGHALELTQDAATTAEERRILRGIIKFGNIEVKQVMRPRTEVVSFDKSLSFPELLQAIVEHGFSRVPIHEETLDRVVGVLHIKDLLPHLGATELNWHALLREPYFVAETMKLDDLLKEFQAQKVHLAVVVDEYGGTSGIITLEDVIEEIVGDITDEYDDEDLIYSKLDDRTWVFEGRAPLTDVYRVLGTDGRDFEERKGESETLGGFILELTGRIPQKGERVDLGPYTFTVEASDNKRVRRVKVLVNEPVRRT